MSHCCCLFIEYHPCLLAQHANSVRCVVLLPVYTCRGKPVRVGVRVTLAGMKCVVSMSKITGGGQWVCDNTGGSQCIDRNTLVDQKNIGVLSESFGGFFGIHQQKKTLSNYYCMWQIDRDWKCNLFPSWHRMNVFFGFHWIYPLNFSTSNSLGCGNFKFSSGAKRTTRVVVW